MWPPLIEERYRGIRNTIIREIRDPKICPACNGRKSVVVAERVVQCERCGGTGKVAVSKRRRAADMGVSWSAYLNTWGAVYEWTFNHVGDLIDTGRSQFKEAVGRIGS